MEKILVCIQTYKSITQTWSKAKPRLAFTLAEVLITLGIIGIVAAMTIPTLQANYQKQEYVTKLKKAYTVFNQALIQMSNDMGCPGDLKCTGLFDDSSELVNTQKFGEEITKHMKVIETANVGGNPDYDPNNIWYKAIRQSLNYDGNPSETTNPNSFSTNYRFITIDGALYSIYSSSDFKNCSGYFSGDFKNVCAAVHIDINGFKPPNYYGRDRFWFYLTSDGPTLYPVGGQKFSVNLSWWKNSDTGQPQYCYPGNTNGRICAGRVMEEGWQMNY